MRRLSLAVCLLLLAASGPALAWGDRGHETVNGAAARGIPESMPEVLRKARARLQYLGPEPDRWKIGDLEAMTKGSSPDHYIDLELALGVDPKAPPPNRHEYAKLLRSRGQEPDDAGFAPYRVVEMCQRIEAAVVAIELVDPKHPDAAARRQQAEEGLIYACGVLGHYVGDLGNPHHTTIHFNGWKGDNPEGFATDRGVHARFESDFVDRLGDRLAIEVSAAPREDLDYTRAVWELIVESNGLVPELYRLDKAGAFTEGNEQGEAATRGEAFVEQRMTRVATLLRDLWATGCAKGRVRAQAERVRIDIAAALEAKAMGDVWVQVTLERAVTLRGRVDSPEDAEAALAIARATPGVTGVTSRIVVLH